MQGHSLELSQSLIPHFRVAGQSLENSPERNGFELSMLCGVMAHPVASFSIDTEGTALSIMWAQEYPC